eukprot:568785-Prymnesium_polylepis.1
MSPPRPAGAWHERNIRAPERPAGGGECDLLCMRASAYHEQHRANTTQQTLVLTPPENADVHVSFHRELAFLHFGVLGPGPASEFRCSTGTRGAELGGDYLWRDANRIFSSTVPERENLPVVCWTSTTCPGCSNADDGSHGQSRSSRPAAERAN